MRMLGTITETTLRSVGESDEAIKAYGKVIESDPHNSSIDWYNKGDV